MESEEAAMGFDCKNDCAFPGWCCRNFTVWSPQIDGDGFLDKSFAFSDVVKFLAEQKWPFEPVKLDEQGFWVLSCTMLRKDGMCSIYGREARPTLCKEYEPFSDTNCCMYIPSCYSS
jgi:hypothetical protein